MPGRHPDAMVDMLLDTVYGAEPGEAVQAPGPTSSVASNPPSGNYDLFGSVFNIDNPTYGGNGNGSADNLAAYNALLAAVPQASPKVGALVFNPVGRRAVSNKVQVTGSGIWFGGVGESGDIIGTPRSITSTIFPSASFPTGSPTEILVWNALSTSVYYIGGGIADMAVDCYIDATHAADGIYARNTYRWKARCIWTAAGVQQGITADATLTQAIDGIWLDKCEAHNIRGTVFNQGAITINGGGKMVEAYLAGCKTLGGSSGNAGVGFELNGQITIGIGLFADGILGRGWRLDQADCVLTTPRIFNGTDLCCVYVAGTNCQITGGDLINPNQHNGASVAGDKSCLWVDGCQDGNFAVGIYAKGTNSLTAILETNVPVGQGNLYSQSNFRGGFSGASAISLQASAKSTIQNIRGYNPLGYITPDPTVTASPYTYTNNTGCMVSVLVTGGTVSLITKGGATIATASNQGMILIGPYETIIVTYSVAPTLKVFGL